MATRTIGKYAAVLTANSEGFTAGMKRATAAASTMYKNVTRIDANLAAYERYRDTFRERDRSAFLSRSFAAQKQSMNRTLAEMAAYESKATAITAQGEGQRARIRSGARFGAEPEPGGISGWQGVNTMFARSSRFAKTLMGGGALMGLSMAANRLRALGESVNATAMEYRAGTISTGEFGAQLGSSIPIIGAVVDGITGLITALTGWENVVARAAKVKLFKQIAKDAQAARNAIEETLRAFDLTDQEKAERKLYLDYQDDLKEISKHEAESRKLSGEEFGPRAAKGHRQMLDDMQRRTELYYRTRRELSEGIQQIFDDEVDAWFDAQDKIKTNEALAAQKRRDALEVRAYEAYWGERWRIFEAGLKKEEDRITQAADEMKAEGKRLKESWRTPMQVYEAEIQKLNDLVAVGIFTWDEYAEGVRRARGELETKARTEVRGPGLIIAGTQEAARVTGTYRERARREEELKKEIAKAAKKAEQQSDERRRLLEKIAEKLSVVEPI